MNTPTEPNAPQRSQNANSDSLAAGTQESNVQNTSNTSVPSAPAADSALKPHPKSSLAVFTPEQLTQISIWVQTEKYDKASDLIFEKFGQKISTGALCRFFRNHVAIVEQLEDTPETAAAAAEILQLAANTNHKFTEASLHVLEQTAFKLSLTCAHKTSDLDLLNRINNIICRSRNTAVRERHATVQEKKTDLRTRELDLKTQIFHARLDGRLTPNLNRPQFAERTSCLGQHSSGGLGKPNLNLLSQDPQNLEAMNSTDAAPSFQKHGRGAFQPRPTSISRDAISDNYGAPADQSASSLKSEINNQKSEMESPSFPSRLSVHSFLSPEVIANTNLYDQKIEAGEIRVIYAPGKHYEIEYCNRADQPALERMHKSAPLRFFEDPTRTQWLPGLRTFGKNPIIPPAAPSSTGGTRSPSLTSNSRDAISDNDAAPTDQRASTSLSQQGRGLGEGFNHPINDSAASRPNAHSEDPSSSVKPEIKNPKSENLETQTSPLKTQNSTSAASLAEVVDAYTVNRIRECIAHNQKHTPWPYRHPAPEFITKDRHCPCGHACPCPTHETISDVGPFPPIFWKITPFHPDYALCLQERNLPFRRPSEYAA